jgi:hypothetical protein
VRGRGCPAARPPRLSSATFRKIFPCTVFLEAVLHPLTMM